MGDSLSIAEFETWTPLAHAIVRLANGSPYRDIAIKALALRLKDGSARIAAEKATWQHHIQERLLERLLILTPGLWQTAMPSSESSFWRSGQYELQLDAKGRHVGYHESNAFLSSITIIGARVDTVDVDRLAVALGIDALPTPPLKGVDASVSEKRKPLPAIEYENASRALVAGWEMTLSEDRAWKMVQGMFPDYSVPRERFLVDYRAIRGTKSLGKQPLRDK